MSDSEINEAIASGFVPADISVEFLEANRDVPATVGIIIITVLTCAVVTCRLLSRKLVVRRFGLGLDDGIALVSLLTFIPFAALCLELVRLGGAKHAAYRDFVLDDATYARFMTVDSIAHLTYSTALLLCRVSGLAFYYRICGLHKEFLIAIRIVFSVLFAGYLAQILLIIFHCRPVTLLWTSMTPEDNDKYQCIEWVDVYVTSSVISLTCDFLLFGIPIAMIRVLDMPRKRKIQLGCILLPGVAVVGISIARLVWVRGSTSETAEEFGFMVILIIEVSEIGATLVALSIPGVKPLVDKYILRKDDANNPRAQVRNQKTEGGYDSDSISLESNSKILDIDGDDYDIKKQPL
ncbi:protein related to integral membrane protein pth11 [Hirsutella rhossiliensis]